MPTNNSSDAAFIARVDPALVAAHELKYAGKSYILMQEGPDLVDANGVVVPYWGDGHWRSDEEQSHFLATLLINHHIIAPFPPLRRNTAGAWEYDPDALVASTSFHRSWDGYGPLALDVSAAACQGVHPTTADPACMPSVFTSAVPNYGLGIGSGVLDAFPNTGTAAEFRTIWDAFKDPDWQIRYACKALTDSTGIVGLARIIIHENWHATLAPKHIFNPAGGTCAEGGGTDPAARCDTFIWDATTSARMYAGLAQQQLEGVGAYQIDQEFMCDLVDHGAPGLPLQTKLVAQTLFETRRAQSRFVNIDPDPMLSNDPEGQFPEDCGVASSILSVPADGTTTCPGTNELRCNVDPDCNDGDSLTADLCVNLCCTHTVVK